MTCIVWSRIYTQIVVVKNFDVFKSVDAPTQTTFYEGISNSRNVDFLLAINSGLTGMWDWIDKVLI